VPQKSKSTAILVGKSKTAFCFYPVFTGENGRFSPFREKQKTVTG